MNENEIFQLIQQEDENICSFINNNSKINQIKLMLNEKSPNKNNLSSFVDKNNNSLQNSNLYEKTLVEQNINSYEFDKLLNVLKTNNQVFIKHRKIANFHQKISWLYLCITSMLIYKIVSQAEIRSKKSLDTRNYLMQFLDCKKSKFNQYVAIGKTLKNYPALIFCNFTNKLISIHNLTSFCIEINHLSKINDKNNNNNHNNHSFISKNKNNQINSNSITSLNYQNLVTRFKVLQKEFNDYCSNYIINLTVENYVKSCFELIYECPNQKSKK